MSKKKNKLKKTTTAKANHNPSTTGQIVRRSNGGDFVFKADNGDFVDIPQTPLAQRLFDAHEKCVIGFSDESKTSGTIIKNLGKAGDPLPEGLAIAERYGVTFPFPDEAMQQAFLSSKQRVTSDGITDYTSIPFFTIDPTNSKDFDDAIYVEKHDDGSFTLYVGIANVGKYVSAGSPLFKDALSRGNSTYLGEQVYPMLPEDLSNDACSLNEKTNKYATVTTINYSPSGNITSYEIGLGVIIAESD